MTRKSDYVSRPIIYINMTNTFSVKLIIILVSIFTCLKISSSRFIKYSKKKYKFLPTALVVQNNYKLVSMQI